MKTTKALLWSMVAVSSVFASNAGAETTKGELFGNSLIPTNWADRSCLVASYGAVENQCGGLRTLQGVINRSEYTAFTYGPVIRMYANSTSEFRFTGVREDNGWIWTNGWKDSHETYDRALTVLSTGYWDTYVPAGGYMLVETRLQAGGRMLGAFIER